MSQSIDIDALVDRIASQVRKRLTQQGINLIEDTCQATSQTCQGSGRCAVKKRATLNRMLQIGATRFTVSLGTTPVDQEIAKYIDHTLLKPDAVRQDLKQLCEEAVRYGFAGVCVNSGNVPFVASQIKGTPVKVVAVVGFPLGAASTSAKVFEAKEAVRNGADEIDMVINIGALKSKDYRLVYEDVRQVAGAVVPRKLKVILETGMLDHDEKVAGCVLSKAAGAAFVKTSTGFGPGGATVEDIELMRRIVGEDMEVKASGGVRSTEAAEALIRAGANRIGASASVAIVTGKKPSSAGY